MRTRHAARRGLSVKLVRLADRVISEGLIGCARRAYVEVNDRLKERHFGISTSSFVEPPALGYGSECERYEPLDDQSIYTIMSKWRVRPADSLLDYGCGMGRVVVVACTRPFRRVIGVEVSPALCRIARANVSSARNMSQASSVEIVEADATEFDVPDDVTVLWFFNPFYGAVMAKVFARIQASLRRAPRRIVLVHVVPDNISCPFVSVDWLQSTMKFRVGPWDRLTCLMFESARQ